MLNGQAPLNNQSQITNGGGLLIWELQNGAEAAGLQTNYVCQEPKSEVQKSAENHKPAAVDSQLKASIKTANESIDTNTIVSRKPIFPSSGEELSTNSQFSIKNIPFNARWFDLSSIHSIEKQHLPEFFEEKPSKTPAIYQRMRNFIVHLYWSNPKQYLTPTACRRYIRGDACSVLRVHAFLEHWSLINSNYKPSNQTLTNQMKEQFSFPTFNREDTKPESKKSPLLSDSTTNSLQKSSVINPTILSSFLKIPTDENGHSSEPITSEFPNIMRIDWFGNFAFKSLLVDRIFDWARYTKPKCHRCLKGVSDTWYVKSLELDLGSRNPRGSVLTLCDLCLESENFPIFFSRNDFQSVTVADLCRSRLKENESLKEWTVEDHTEVVTILTKSDGLDSTLSELKKKFPDRKEGEFLLIILQIAKEMDNSQASPKVPTRENQLTYQKSFLKSFENKLDQVDKILEENPFKEFTEEMKKHLPHYDQKKAGESGSDFDEKMQKITKKLSFFAEFEKILHHEKLNLQMIR